MVDYAKMRKKFPGKDPKKVSNAQKIKAIAREYERKKAELAASAPDIKRGFPYYMAIVIGMLLVSGLVGSAIFKRGGIDIAGRNAKKATESVRNLALALGRYRYHVGRFPSTEEGLEQLASKNVTARGWNGPYIRDLKPDPWKNEYVYVYNGESEPPTLYSAGPDGAPGTTDDIIANRADFDAAFRDISWTKDWVPMHLRDIVVAQDEKQKKALQEEVRRILHPDIPAEGVTPLRDGWTRTEGGGWRKTFDIPEKARGRHVSLAFSSVRGGWTVVFNGAAAGTGRDGTAGFELDVSDKAVFGGSNTLEAFAPGAYACTAGGAWVSGDVSLRIEDPVSRILPGTLSTETLEIGKDAAKMRLKYDTPSGAVTNDFDCVSPSLWTPERPFLQKGWLLGRFHHYAIRTYGRSAGGEFLLNGEPYALKGVSMDGGCGMPGGAFVREAAMRRLLALKECGANAIRFTGGANREWLGLCDETGFIAIDETLFPESASWPEAFAPPSRWNGLFDAAAFPREGAALCRAAWREDAMTVRFATDWNGEEGAKKRVALAVSGDEAELFVNGESAGRRRISGTGPAGRLLEWEPEFEAGELKAIAYEKGVYMGETAIKTPYAPDALVMACAKSALSDGETGFVEISVEDAGGVIAADAKAMVEISLSGPGEITAVANAEGAAVADEPGRATVKATGGRALVAVRRNIGGSGLPLRLAAKSSRLRGARADIPRR